MVEPTAQGLANRKTRFALLSYEGLHYMTKINQCLILAAGNGTRLRPVSNGLPKPLVQFRGKPILEHVILRAHQAGINNFVIVVGFRSVLIRTWFDKDWFESRGLGK